MARKQVGNAEAAQKLGVCVVWWPESGVVTTDVVGG